MKEYAIVRRDDDVGDRHAWIVNMRRRGGLINRYFADLYYGGREGALEAARAYRDAILQAFPPYTTLEFVQGVRKDNQSGVSGVQHAYTGKRHMGWMATIQTAAGKKTKTFSFHKYGEQALEKAIEQRMAWLQQREDKFFTREPVVAEFANEAFAHLLGQIEIDDSTIEGFRAKLKAVNEAFYATFPRYVHVSVYVRQARGRRSLKGRVYSAAIKKRFLPILVLQGRPLTLVLLQMRDNLVNFLSKECGAETASRFLEEHGWNLTQVGFDPVKGFLVRTKIGAT